MDLTRALAFSRYAERGFAAHPALADELAAAPAAPFAWDDVARGVDDVVARLDAAALARALRVLRRRVFLHTMVRDLAGTAPVEEVCGTMTRLAEVSLGAAVRLHAQLLRERYGDPVGREHGAPQELIAIGMGKLGGGELNVSSDIDLIFVYPDEGETTGPRGIANREFFDRLGQRVIAAVNDATPDGYVFRVDMRLRPYGDSGPLTTTFIGLETYLVTQGRAWERYAWLKARALTGSRHNELAALVTPFVYR
jgi:glutamate-ammonia-ligase adenylyltransferase